MHAILFHNPTAGARSHTRKLLTEELEFAGFTVTYCSTDDKDAFASAIPMADQADLSVVAGGDGTIAKVATSLTNRKVPIAIVPLGTANNIARSYEIFGPAWDLEGWNTTDWRPLNIGCVEGPWGKRRFVEGVGIGAFADAMDIASKAKMNGLAKLRTGRSAIAERLMEAEPLDVRATLDGVVLPGRLLAIEALAVAYTGPALPLAPMALDAKPLLNVVACAIEHRDAAIAWAKQPKNTPPPMALYRGEVVNWTFHSEGKQNDGGQCGALRNIGLRIDDEYLELPSATGSIRITLEAEPVRVLVRPRWTPVFAIDAAIGREDRFK